ncbi:hypothetical protein A1L58_05115 [Shewanella baltica]|nr:hypothetical protein A1L58_05115 [Shewanella baltica]
MNQQRHLTLFEYDSVLVEGVGIEGNTLPFSVFSWLKSLCLDESTVVDDRDDTDIEVGANHFMQLGSVRGRETIRFSHYVGVLQSPCGFQIEILPKTGRIDGTPAQSRDLVLRMLACLDDMPAIECGSADLAHFNTLLEWLMGRFLKACNTVLKHGLRSTYVEQEENQTYLKGKLLAAQQLRHNLVQRQRNFVRFDERLTDRPENRLLRSALECVASQSQNEFNLKLCRELRFAFNDVPASCSIKRDIKDIRLDRGMGYYREAIDWCKLVLNGVTPFSQLGNDMGISMLFPMHTLFEALVEKCLRRQLPPQMSIKSQGAATSLVTHRQQNWFRLKPDLQLFEQKKLIAILDTKWKLLDTAKGNGTDKYGLSQADFYQLFAYGHQLLGGNGELFLIYPKTASFQEPIAATFCFSESLRLWVVPFDLERERVIWPAAMTLPLDAVIGNSH